MPVLFEVPELRASEFARICELAYRRCGLHLREGKEQLVSSRLAKLIRTGGFRSFDAYYEHVLRDSTGDALVTMLDCLTTNHTSFLREAEHFQLLVSAVAPAFAARGPLRIWSAACSSGEEPFSLVMSLLASGVCTADRLEVVATDISSRVLAAARSGLYTAEKVEALPREWVSRFFSKGGGESAGLYRVKPEILRLVRFERLNLIEPLPRGTCYPVIFCRNVMIYFDRQTRADLVRRLTECLEPGGFLFVGHAESLIGTDHRLEYVRPAVYRKGGAAEAVRSR